MKQIRILTLTIITLSIVSSVALGYDPYTGRFQQPDPVGTGPRIVSGPHGPQFVGLNGPTPPNPNAQTVQGIPVAHIQATIANNPQTAQAFSAVGANQYDDGMSTYQYTGSNPVNRVDPMGLAWYVNRNGGATASVWPIVSPDTIKKLSSKIGLEYMEFKSWLGRSDDIRTEDGVKTVKELLGTDKICPNQRFSIPNTVLAHWAGEYKGSGRWWVNWERDTAYLSSLGFAVDYRNGSTANAFETYLENKTLSKELHGMFFWGHGVPDENKYYWGLITDWEAFRAAKNNGTQRDYITNYRDNWNLEYRLGLGLIYACGGKHTMVGNFSSNSIHWGDPGTLYPIGTPPVSDHIKPGDQMTKPKIIIP